MELPIQRSGMRSGGVLYWDVVTGPVANSTHPARARVAEGTVTTVPNLSLGRGEQSISLLGR